MILAIMGIPVGIIKRRMVATGIAMTDILSHGRNFPFLKFTLSMIMPKIGSLMASHTFVISATIATNAAVMPISVKYVVIYPISP